MKTYVFKGLLVLIFLCLFNKSYSQFNTTFFDDTLHTINFKEGKIKKVISSNQHLYALIDYKFQSGANFPILYKFNKKGDIIWSSTLNSKTKLHPFPKFSFDFDAYDFFQIDTISYVITWSGEWSSTNKNSEIWAINNNNGSVLWSVRLNQRTNSVYNYDDKTILTISKDASQNKYINLISKENGKILLTKTSFPKFDFLEINSQKNIMLTDIDTLNVYQDLSLNNLIWKSQNPTNLYPFRVENFLKEDGKYFLMGMNRIKCLDSINGNSIWDETYTPGFISGGVQGSCFADPIDYISKDTMLFVLWRSPTTSSNQRGYSITCINKKNGNVIYYSSHDLNGIPADSSQYTDYKNEKDDYPVSMKLDSNNALYITGAYDGIFEGNWGNIKLNSKDGSIIYEYPITLDSTKRNINSTGIFIETIEDKVYNFGNIQYDTADKYKIAPALIIFDSTINHKEHVRKILNMSYIAPSITRGILNFDNNKFALLKQQGFSGLIELRNNNKSLIWSKIYKQKNKFCVPLHFKNIKNKFIVASFALYNRQLENYNYKLNIDSILFVKIDSNGKEVFSHKVFFPFDTLKAAQIFIDSSENVNFLYKVKTINRIYLDQASYVLGDMNDSLTAFGFGVILNYEDLTMDKQEIFCEYKKDSLIYFYIDQFTLETNCKVSTSFKNNYNDYNGYFKSLPTLNFKNLAGAIKLKDQFYFLMGSDKNESICYAIVNVLDSIARVVWQKTSLHKGQMLRIDNDLDNIYSVSELKSGGVLICRIDKKTGNVIWQKEIKTIGENKIMPTQIKLNNTKDKIAVTGFYYDSLKNANYSNNTTFFFKLDTLGGIIDSSIQKGYGEDETRITTLDCLSNNQFIYGGSFNHKTRGVCGFYNLECNANSLTPKISINTNSNLFCNNQIVNFNSTSENEGDSPKYQWFVNGSLRDSVSTIFSSNTLNNSDTIKVLLKSNANCLVKNEAISNLIIMKKLNKISSKIEIDSISSNNSSYTLKVTKLVDTGNVNYLQWQDSTELHGWENISSENGYFINYLYPKVKNKIRCKLITENACNKDTSTSNVYTFKSSISSSITLYPNPVNNILTFNNLNLADAWQYFEIISLSGKGLFTKNISGLTSFNLNVSSLKNDIYLAVFRRSNGNSTYLKFIKI